MTNPEGSSCEGAGLLGRHLCRYLNMYIYIYISLSLSFSFTSRVCKISRKKNTDTGAPPGCCIRTSDRKAQYKCVCYCEISARPTSFTSTGHLKFTNTSTGGVPWMTPLSTTYSLHVGGGLSLPIEDRILYMGHTRHTEPVHIQSPVLPRSGQVLHVGSNISVTCKQVPRATI